KKVAALITGGYHTEGLSDIMEQKGLSYLVVVPKFEGGRERPYVAILTNKKKAYEKLLESGQYQLAVSAYFYGYDGDLTRLKPMIFHAMGEAVLDIGDRDIESVKKEWVANYEAGYNSIPADKRNEIYGRCATPRDFSEYLGKIRPIMVGSVAVIQDLTIDPEKGNFITVVRKKETGGEEYFDLNPATKAEREAFARGAVPAVVEMAAILKEMQREVSEIRGLKEELRAVTEALKGSLQQGEADDALVLKRLTSDEKLAGQVFEALEGGGLTARNVREVLRGLKEGSLVLPQGWQKDKDYREGVDGLISTVEKLQKQQITREYILTRNIVTTDIFTVLFGLILDGDSAVLAGEFLSCLDKIDGEAGRLETFVDRMDGIVRKGRRKRILNRGPGENYSFDMGAAGREGTSLSPASLEALRDIWGTERALMVRLKDIVEGYASGMRKAAESDYDKARDNIDKGLINLFDLKQYVENHRNKLEEVYRESADPAAQAVSIAEAEAELDENLKESEKRAADSIALLEQFVGKAALEAALEAAPKIKERRGFILREAAAGFAFLGVTFGFVPALIIITVIAGITVALNRSSGVYYGFSRPLAFMNGWFDILRSVAQTASEKKRLEPAARRAEEAKPEETTGKIEQALLDAFHAKMAADARAEGRAVPAGEDTRYRKGQVEAMRLLKDGAFTRLRTGGGKTLTLAGAALMRIEENRAKKSDEKIFIFTHSDILTRQAMDDGIGDILGRCGATAGFIIADEKEEGKETGFIYDRDKDAIVPATVEDVYGKCDVIYTTRDRAIHRNMGEKTGSTSTPKALRNNRYFALFDEADIQLVFSAATPCIISGDRRGDWQARLEVRRAIMEDPGVMKVLENKDYAARMDTREAYLTSRGEAAIKDVFDRLKTGWKSDGEKGAELIKVLNANGDVFILDALKAHLFYREGEQYFKMTKDGRENINVIDEETKTRKPGMTFGSGLHQAIEIMAGLKTSDLTPETYTMMSQTIGQFLAEDLITDYAGASGTMEEERMKALYAESKRKKGNELRIAQIEGEEENLEGKDDAHTGFENAGRKKEAVRESVKSRFRDNRPVMIKVEDAVKAEDLRKYLKAELTGPEFSDKVINVIDGRYTKDFEKNRVLAGYANVITIVTNVAHRGIDIGIKGRRVKIDNEEDRNITGEQDLELAPGEKAPGLHVISAYLDEAEAFELQTKGRADRGVNRGSWEGLFSLDEEIFRKYDSIMEPQMAVLRGAAVSGDPEGKKEDVKKAVREIREFIVDKRSREDRDRQEFENRVFSLQERILERRRVADLATEKRPPEDIGFLEQVGAYNLLEATMLMNLEEGKTLTAGQLEDAKDELYERGYFIQFMFNAGVWGAFTRNLKPGESLIAKIDALRKNIGAGIDMELQKFHTEQQDSAARLGYMAGSERLGFKPALGQLDDKYTKLSLLKENIGRKEENVKRLIATTLAAGIGEGIEGIEEAEKPAKKGISKRWRTAGIIAAVLGAGAAIGMGAVGLVTTSLFKPLVAAVAAYSPVVGVITALMVIPAVYLRQIYGKKISQLDRSGIKLMSFAAGMGEGSFARALGRWAGIMALQLLAGVGLYGGAFALVAAIAHPVIMIGNLAFSAMPVAFTAVALALVSNLVLIKIFRAEFARAKDIRPTLFKSRVRMFVRAVTITAAFMFAVTASNGALLPAAVSMALVAASAVFSIRHFRKIEGAYFSGIGRPQAGLIRFGGVIGAAILVGFAGWVGGAEVAGIAGIMAKYAVAGLGIGNILMQVLRGRRLKPISEATGTGYGRVFWGSFIPNFRNLVMYAAAVLGVIVTSQNVIAAGLLVAGSVAAALIVDRYSANIENLLGRKRSEAIAEALGSGVIMTGAGIAPMVGYPQAAANYILTAETAAEVSPEKATLLAEIERIKELSAEKNRGFNNLLANVDIAIDAMLGEKALAGVSDTIRLAGKAEEKLLVAAKNLIDRVVDEVNNGILFPAALSAAELPAQLAPETDTLGGLDDILEFIRRRPEHRVLVEPVLSLAGRVSTGVVFSPEYNNAFYQVRGEKLFWGRMEVSGLFEVLVTLGYVAAPDGKVTEMPAADFAGKMREGLYKFQVEERLSMKDGKAGLETMTALMKKLLAGGISRGPAQAAAAVTAAEEVKVSVPARQRVVTGTEQLAAEARQLLASARQARKEAETARAAREKAEEAREAREERMRRAEAARLEEEARRAEPKMPPGQLEAVRENLRMANDALIARGGIYERMPDGKFRIVSAGHREGDRYFDAGGSMEVDRTGDPRRIIKYVECEGDVWKFERPKVVAARVTEKKFIFFATGVEEQAFIINSAKDIPDGARLMSGGEVVDITRLEDADALIVVDPSTKEEARWNLFHPYAAMTREVAPGQMDMKYFENDLQAENFNFYSEHPSTGGKVRVAPGKDVFPDTVVGTDGVRRPYAGNFTSPVIDPATGHLTRLSGGEVQSLSGIIAGALLSAGARAQEKLAEKEWAAIASARLVGLPDNITASLSASVEGDLGPGVTIPLFKFDERLASYVRNAWVNYLRQDVSAEAFKKQKVFSAIEVYKDYFDAKNRERTVRRSLDEARRELGEALADRKSAVRAVRDRVSTLEAEFAAARVGTENVREAMRRVMGLPGAAPIEIIGPGGIDASLVNECLLSNNIEPMDFWRDYIGQVRRLGVVQIDSQLEKDVAESKRRYSLGLNLGWPFIASPSFRTEKGPAPSPTLAAIRKESESSVEAKRDRELVYQLRDLKALEAYLLDMRDAQLPGRIRALEEKVRQKEERFREGFITYDELVLTREELTGATIFLSDIRTLYDVTEAKIEDVKRYVREVRPAAVTMKAGPAAVFQGLISGAMGAAERPAGELFPKVEAMRFDEERLRLAGEKADGEWWGWGSWKEYRPEIRAMLEHSRGENQVRLDIGRMEYAGSVFAAAMEYRLAQENLDIAGSERERLVTEIKPRVESRAKKLEMEVFEAELSAAEIRVRDSEKKLDAALNELKRVLGYALDEEIELGRPAGALTKEEVERLLSLEAFTDPVTGGSILDARKNVQALEKLREKYVSLLGLAASGNARKVGSLLRTLGELDRNGYFTRSIKIGEGIDLFSKDEALVEYLSRQIEIVEAGIDREKERFSLERCNNEAALELASRAFTAAEERYKSAELAYRTVYSNIAASDKELLAAFSRLSGAGSDLIARKRAYALASLNNMKTSVVNPDEAGRIAVERDLADRAYVDERAVRMRGLADKAAEQERLSREILDKVLSRGQRLKASFGPVLSGTETGGPSDSIVVDPTLPREYTVSAQATAGFNVYNINDHMLDAQAGVLRRAAGIVTEVQAMEDYRELVGMVHGIHAMDMKARLIEREMEGLKQDRNAVERR
ncbi:MAG: hypothetical protein ABIA77_04965, partial [Candidatus Omnitrophota bacterium]